MGLKPVNFPVKTNPLTDIFPENSKGPIGPESDSIYDFPSDLGQESPAFRS